MADRDTLLEEVVGAWRGSDAHGRIEAHPAWHDLDLPDRAYAFDQTVDQRRLEAALDPDGLSTTARAVLARIHGGPGPR